MTHGRRSNDSDDLDVRTLRSASNGWVARLRALREFINEPGGMATVGLVFVLGVYTGWIPSPLSDLMTLSISHDARLVESTTRRVELDVKRDEILARLAKIVEELGAERRAQNRRESIRLCSEIKDFDLRRRCLE